LQQGLQFQIIENEDLNGSTDNGMVTVIVDDGSGNTPSTTVSAVFNVINAVRAAGVRIGVFAASKLTANITVSISVAQGFIATNVQAAVLSALGAATNSAGLGNPFDYMMIGQVCFNTPGVATVPAGALLNGGAGDLVPTKLQTIKSGTITVNVVS
jgi:hypothetical protein